MHVMEDDTFKKDVFVRKSESAQGVLGMCPTNVACTFTDPADICPPNARKAFSDRSKELELSMETK